MRTVARIPFKHLEACPDCGRMNLKIVRSKMYPGEDGIYQLVVYLCPYGHRIPSRQLVAKQEGVPPKELWEGWI